MVVRKEGSNNLYLLIIFWNKYTWNRKKVRLHNKYNASNTIKRNQSKKKLNDTKNEHNQVAILRVLLKKVYYIILK